jgi:hypothetical protein
VKWGEVTANVPPAGAQPGGPDRGRDAPTGPGPGRWKPLILGALAGMVLIGFWETFTESYVSERTKMGNDVSRVLTKSLVVGVPPALVAGVVAWVLFKREERSDRASKR